MAECYGALRAGLTYRDWAGMTRWQVGGYLATRHKEMEERFTAANRDGWQGLLGALVRRILGG